MNIRQRILFFIAGSAPTAAESAAAAKLGTKMFRNASQVFAGDTPETCNAVAGLVPALYSHLPRADAVAEPASSTGNSAAGESIVATGSNPPDFVKPADANAAAKAEDPAVALRAAEDAGAARATVAQLKAALAQFGIEIPQGAKKADLLALFIARPSAPAEPAAPASV